MKVCSICQRCYEGTAVSCVETEHPELSETRTGGPDMIAGYQLDLLLESGLKGEVYRALRTDSQLSCLIKIVPSNEESKQKFLQDAKTATTLFNQSVVDVYEFGSLESGEVFVVAEDPAGQTVRELLNNVGVPQLLTTVQVVRQTAEAIHALHLSGLTHRAIRPENIILTTDAEHRLLIRIQNIDLGGVAEHSVVSNKFLIDTALDSLRYFAPEQFTGEGASAKSDVYSLGIVLYEMLAGAPPFDAEKASGLIDLHRSQRPPDVRIDNFDLRMLLMHSLMESLQKGPAKRQSSANAFARQLRHIEQLATHSPTPPPASIDPPVPPRGIVAPSTAGTAVRSAPVKHVDEILPATLEVQPGLVTEPVAAPILEPGPSSLAPNKIEIITDVDLEIPSNVNEVLELTIEQPVEVATKPRPEPAPKSRLKRLKKQLHLYTTPVVAAQSEAPSTPSAVEVKEEELSVARGNIGPKKLESEQANEYIPSQDNLSSPEETPEGQSAVQTTAEPALVVPVMLAAVAAAPAPRKIEWQQPKDDIPSLDDIPEALLAEPMPQESVVSTAPIVAPIPTVPRKIEWAQPEDDIPSLDDISEILLSEPMPATPVIPEPQLLAPPSPISSIPRKVEWDQPEDDIPSMEDILQVLSEEPAIEAAFAAPAAEEDIAFAQLDRSPNRIAWEQPEDDIPSIDDVMEVLASEQIAESPLVQPLPEDVPAISISVPVKLESVRREEDIPSIEEAPEVLCGVSGVQAEPDEVPIAESYREPAAVECSNVISVVEPEPEEITLVSPPRRIQIDWEQPKPWETLTKEIEFFPTLLGDIDTKRKTDPHTEPFFSDYAEAEPRSSEHYRSLMIGSGFIVLIVLFLFGNDSVWKYFQGGSAVDSVAVQTTSPKQTFPQPGQTTPPNEQRLLKNFEKPKSDDDGMGSDMSKPTSIKVSSPTSEGTASSPPDKPPAPNKETQAKKSERSAGKTPVVPSTLVISSDGGKVSSKVEPQKRKSTEPTRPRIVENPNP